MSRAFPPQNWTVDILFEVARRSLSESSEHPEDIANGLIFAIEHAAETLKLLMERGSL